MRGEGELAFGGHQRLITVGEGKEGAEEDAMRIENDEARLLGGGRHALSIEGVHGGRAPGLDSSNAYGRADSSPGVAVVHQKFLLFLLLIIQKHCNYLIISFSFY